MMEKKKTREKLKKIFESKYKKPSTLSPNSMHNFHVLYDFVSGIDESNFTAIQWLERHLPSLFEHDESGFYKDLFERAKTMEKEQAKECWETAHQAGRFEGKGIAEKNWQTFEQYFKETYGK